MTLDVVFRREAENEVLEAQRWYESRREGLGDEFADALDALVARIVANPLAFRRVRGETRRGILSRFPYAVYFRLTGQEIVVLAVHGRQDPSRWQNR